VSNEANARLAENDTGAPSKTQGEQVVKVHDGGNTCSTMVAARPAVENSSETIRLMQIRCNMGYPG
jgi:hypothetical protein